jgi:hypothetical protein
VVVEELERAREDVERDGYAQLRGRVHAEEPAGHAGADGGRQPRRQRTADARIAAPERPRVVRLQALPQPHQEAVQQPVPDEDE